MVPKVSHAITFKEMAGSLNVSGIAYLMTYHLPHAFEYLFLTHILQVKL